MRRIAPGRALAVLVLLVLPSMALAQPSQAHERRVPAERNVEAGLFARLWSAWAHLWSQEGSGLDPEGLKPQVSNPGGSGASPFGDTGSGLDPDGK